MANKYLTVRLDNSKVDLTNSVSLAYDKTNLPKHAFKFKTHAPVYWKLEQKHYDFETGTLTVDVTDYNSTQDSISDKQEPKYPIKNLKFERLDWEKFEPLLFTYTFGQLKQLLFNYQNSVLYMKDEKSEDVKSLKRTAPNLFFSKREPVREEREIEVKVKYEEAKFEASKISFSVHLKSFKLVKQLEIVNPNLRPEFEYIKPYFSKRLGRSFLAKIKLSLLDNQVEQIIATSDDINNIDENLIDTIKIKSVLNLKHFKSEREDKVLYNTDELSAENKQSSLLNTSAKDILEIFIANGKVRNVRQLEYLAKDKQSLNERLRFTIKPMFGFVFTASKDNGCFVWELLNSHATYVWKNNNLQNKLDLSKIVEEAIGTIKNDGREPYKKYYNAIELPSYDFRVIDHSSNNLTEEERFDEWRKKLERICQ